MFIVSVTRLKVRSIWYIVPFLVATTASRRQVRRAPGFVAGRLGVERSLAFWTITVWSSEEAMRAFRNTGVHRRAMPHLLKWCNEASYVHWEQDDATLPSIEVAHERLRTSGRLSKVNHPTAAQRDGRTASDVKPQAGPAITPVT